MTLTIMRKAFKKQRPRIINYRSFKHFSNEEFRKSLIDNLSNQIYVNNDDGFNRFCKISIVTLNSFAPIKNTFVRANKMPFITKGLSRETMKWSRLRNNFLQKKTEETPKLYVKQKNSNSRYNLRKFSQFSRFLVKPVYHGTESISYLGPKIWDVLPDDYETIQNSDTFKIKIKKWKPENCPCRLCKVYIDRVGFLLKS